jgi:hypothetical protein
VEIGPVEVLVLGLPGNRFKGTILPAPSYLVGTGTTGGST